MSHKRLTIAVISPAGIPDPAGLEQGLSLIRSWGHEVITGPHVGAKWRYMAGDNDQRSADLRWAFETTGIDVVWIARGGFGVQHCLKALPVGMNDDRIVIGCSDATALLHYLSLQGHTRLVHGPMIDTLASGVTDETRARVRHILTGNFHGEMPVSSSNQAALEGKLIGGNLTMLASMCGTPQQINTRGAILMLEDVTEHAFRLDRMVLQLRDSGALDGVKAIVLGEYVRCYLPAGADYTADELMENLLQPLGVRVVRGAGFGHGRDNYAWPYGHNAQLQGGRLVF
ncbi:MULTISPECIES: S66 peptidase family protein [Pseudomonas]|jgi:muramoyltetrapeptide carboxypeptidase|nr:MULTISPECIES: LD-carboxypeptidase [Pseudomonas]MCF5517977.1 LD-carboxypeptidase [Pseudomonas sp. PA-3-6E]MCF5564800.1 LD-carboxypeptidase [Pseudomonas sp. PA-3-5D]MCF5569963.1 LD-carboxypeptidase [Pseudomonas sp. PA-3-11C]OKP67356.1 LD-carboxypeptidase [Pseudomonas fluorescens]MCF5510573.1 LD-carboxypeptidase [Pseudomonas sp. PA-3-6H]